MIKLCFKTLSHVKLGPFLAQDGELLLERKEENKIAKEDVEFKNVCKMSSDWLYWFE